MKAEQEEIESSIGFSCEWRWSKYPGYSFSTINIRKDGTIDDPPEKLEETRAWMLEMLPKFKDVFEGRVESLLTKLRTPRGNGAGQA